MVSRQIGGAIGVAITGAVASGSIAPGCRWTASRSARPRRAASSVPERCHRATERAGTRNRQPPGRDGGCRDGQGGRGRDGAVGGVGPPGGGHRILFAASAPGSALREPPKPIPGRLRQSHPRRWNDPRRGRAGERRLVAGRASADTDRRGAAVGCARQERSDAFAIACAGNKGLVMIRAADIGGGRRGRSMGAWRLTGARPPLHI